jgi:protein PhnA
MTTEKLLHERSDSKCELCTVTDNLGVYDVPPESNSSPDNNILICQTCCNQIENGEAIDINHWRCLNDSMWSQIPAVQVVAWRMLTRLSSEGWPQDLLDMLYLDDEALAWAQATGEGQKNNTQGNNKSKEDEVKHMDSNGTVLVAGDTVTLIKDLNVKGANFTAKRGPAVRNISLVADNAEHIEGKVNAQQIVLLTKFVKKSN